MARNIKEEILIKATELFNASSYNDVSMRDIADALSISVGNLTYHYKKKEDIIFEIVTEQHKHYKKKPIAETVLELDLKFQRMVCNQQKSAHYFRHYTQLSQTYPQVAEVQLSIMRDWYDTIKGSLVALQKNGYIKEAEFKGQLDGIIHSIITITTFGVQHLERTKKGGLEYSQRNSLWSVIYFMLTPKGIESFKNDVEPTLD